MTLSKLLNHLIELPRKPSKSPGHGTIVLKPLTLKPPVDLGSQNTFESFSTHCALSGYQYANVALGRSSEIGSCVSLPSRYMCSVYIRKVSSQYRCAPVFGLICKLAIVSYVSIVEHQVSGTLFE